MTTQMIIRVEEEIKTKVNRLAKADGKNVSAVVRELLENYVKERDMSSYMEDLWNRIGSGLKEQGVKPGDIERAIREVRAGK